MLNNDRPPLQVASVADIGMTLRRMLRDGTDAHRCSAAQALGRIGCLDAFDDLAESLAEEDEDIRGDAAAALCRLGTPQAAAPLLESLIRDPARAVKVEAIRALAAMGSTPAIPVFRRVASGRDESLVWDDQELLETGWDDWLDVQVEAVKALGRMGAKDATSDIVAAINDEMGQDLAEVGTQALAGLGAPGLAALSEYLNATDERLRRRAARALRHATPEEGRALFQHALKNVSPEVRKIAAEVIALRDPSDPCLRSLFADTESTVRATVVRLCGQRWPDRLDALLDDPSDDVQEAVLELLAGRDEIAPPPDLLRRLRVKLRGPSVAVAVVAARAIVRHAPDIAADDLSEQLGDLACPVPVRRAAARALGDLATTQSIDALIGAISDGERSVRVEAMATLARIAAAAKEENGTATAALLAALSGELVSPPPGPDAVEEHDGAAAPDSPRDKETRLASELVAIKQDSDRTGTDGSHGENEASAEVSREHQSNWPKSTLQALTEQKAAETGTRKRPETTELDETEREYLTLARTLPRRKRVTLRGNVAVHTDVRHLAARVLGDVPTERVVEALVGQLEDDDIELRRAVAESLARLGEQMRPVSSLTFGAALSHATRDADRDVRLAATRACAYVGANLAPTIAERLSDTDPHVRAAAALSLAAVGAAGEEVANLLADDDPGVRIAAAKSLASRGGQFAMDQLFEFGFAHSGMHHCEASRLLRSVDRDGATTRFLATLEDSRQKQRWRVAIEALGELHSDESHRWVAP